MDTEKQFVVMSKKDVEEMIQQAAVAGAQVASDTMLVAQRRAEKERIDLEGLYNIYKFKTYDCKHNESGANFNNYRVYVSTDKVNWTLVLDETGVGNETIKEDYIAPTKARYVKFNPYDDNSMTIRIWEFEVYGKDAVNLQVTVPGEVSLKSKESKTIEVAYDLNGDVRNENFACTVTSGNENYVKVGKDKVKELEVWKRQR